MINGKVKWAWLQIDRNNYETSSHFDTGEHGAMTEHILGNLLNDSAQFIIGAWKGVESSLWMVSAFSLLSSDEKQIRENARACLEGATVSLGVSKSVGPGEIGWDVGGSGASASLGPLKLDVTSKGLMPNQNVIGWSNGYKAGIALYFDR